MKKLSYGLFFVFIMSFTSAYAEVNPDSIVNIFQRLEELEKKVRELNGDNEVLKHQLDKLKKDQKQGFLNVDERLEQLANPKEKTEASTPAATDKDETVKVIEKKLKAATTNSKADNKDNKQTSADAKKPDSSQTTDKGTKPKLNKTSGSASAPKNKPRAPTAYEKETYQSAFNLMKKSPTAATKAFQEYIKLQPNSPLAANAQYWIAEIMYSHNNYKGAVNEFIKVLQKYKYSNKAPDAAIKLGYSFYALKKWDFAKRTFEDVLKYFPDNENAVTLAKKRLAKMKAEGH